MKATTAEIRKSFELNNNRKRSKMSERTRHNLTVFRGEVTALSPYAGKGDRADNQWLEIQVSISNSNTATWRNSKEMASIKKEKANPMKKFNKVGGRCKNQCIGQGKPLICGSHIIVTQRGWTHWAHRDLGCLPWSRLVQSLQIPPWALPREI